MAFVLIALTVLAAWSVGHLGSMIAAQDHQAVIPWQSYEEGMEVSRREGKPVMLCFWAPWCKWCRKLEEVVFADPAVVDLSKRFICVSVDGSARPDLTRTHEVDCYPTILFLDARGKEVKRIDQYVPSEIMRSAMLEAAAQAMQNKAGGGR